MPLPQPPPASLSVLQSCDDGDGYCDGLKNRTNKIVICLLSQDMGNASSGSQALHDIFSHGDLRIHPDEKLPHFGPKEGCFLSVVAQLITRTQAAQKLDDDFLLAARRAIWAWASSAERKELTLKHLLLIKNLDEDNPSSQHYSLPDGGARISSLDEYCTWLLSKTDNEFPDLGEVELEIICEMLSIKLSLYRFEDDNNDSGETLEFGDSSCKVHLECELDDDDYFSPIFYPGDTVWRIFSSKK